ncbi:MAG TPA: rhodanese-like domain-containing protein [Pyrinomonadaceae bacterium]
MRFKVARMAVVIMALVALAGCNSNDKVGKNSSAQTPLPPRPGQPAPQQPAQNALGDNVRRVTTVELEDAIKKGQAIIVDVRNDAAFKQGHIKDSILIPSTEIANHLDKLPRDKMIVTYCA